MENEKHGEVGCKTRAAIHQSTHGSIELMILKLNKTIK